MAFNPKGFVSVDTETTGLHVWHGDRPFAVGMCDDVDGDTWYTEWPVNPETREVTPDPTDLKFIQSILGNGNLTKVFHHARFDVRMLSMIGLETVGRIEDTLFAARVCNTLEYTYGLKALARRYAGISLDDEADLKDAVKKGRVTARKLGWLLGGESEQDYWIPRTLDPENRLCQKYCELDVVRTMMLWIMYEDMMESDPRLRATYDKEMKLWYVVMRMEERGVRIDRERTLQELEHSQRSAEEHRAAMYQLAGGEFKEGSSKELVKIIYGKFGLEVKRRTDKGTPSTDWKALREHADHPFVREMLAYRSAEKSISTFFIKYRDMMLPDPLNPGGWVLHPGFNQCGTLTGRFSCSDPNLQQVANSNTSARGTDPIQARAPFGPRPGYVWYLGDYSQMELRMFADIADEPFMLKAIAEGRELHTECANKAWGGRGNLNALKAAAYALELGHSEPTKTEVADAWRELGWNHVKAKLGVLSTEAIMVAEEWLKSFDYDIVKAEKSLGKSGTRGRAKCVMYTKIYGGGPKAVADLLYCSEQEAKEFLQQYDMSFPRIKEYMETRSRQAAHDRCVYTRFGRRLDIDPDFCYRAVNYEVQGSGADLVKDSILRTDEYLRGTGLDAHVLMQIHDELIFEVNKKHSYRWLVRGLRDIMEDTGGRFRIEMPVEFKRSDSQWDQKVSVEL